MPLSGGLIGGSRLAGFDSLISASIAHCSLKSRLKLPDNRYACGMCRGVLLRAKSTPKRHAKGVGANSKQEGYDIDG